MRFVVYKDPIDKYRVHIPEMVGVDNNWRLPMKILNLNLAEYLLLVKTEYFANVRFYKGADNKIRFIGLYWDEAHKKYAENFKNLLNKKMQLVQIS